MELSHTFTASLTGCTAAELPGAYGSRETCVWGHPLWLTKLWRRLGWPARSRLSIHLLHRRWSSCCTWKQKALWPTPRSAGPERLTASHLAVDEAVQHSHHETLTDERERKRELEHTRAHTHTHTFSSALTCVDDSASSAKVQILNTQLFTSTGRNTNRM